MNPKDIIGSTKPSLALIPPALSVLLAAVQDYGDKKYGQFNWRKQPVSRMTYYNAALRHITAVIDGEDLDADSGLPHEAHAAASLGIILDAWATGNLIDDRPPAGAAGDLIRALTVANNVAN